jgi:hypothetical protein
MTGEQRKFRIQSHGSPVWVPFERQGNYSTKAKAQAVAKYIRSLHRGGGDARVTKERYPKWLGVRGRQIYYAVWVF